MKPARFGSPGRNGRDCSHPTGRITDISAHVAAADHAFFASGGMDVVRAGAARSDDLPDAPARQRCERVQA